MIKLPGAISPAIIFKKSIYETRESSYLEIALFYYLKNAFSDTVNLYHPAWLMGDRGNTEKVLDFYIPSINLGIVLKDSKVIRKSKIHGIRLLPVCTDGLSDEDVIRETFQTLPAFVKCDGVIPELNLTRDIDPIYESYLKNFKCPIGGPVGYTREEYLQSLHIVSSESSIKILYPDLAKEMADVLNGDIRSDMVSPWSSLKVWWHCPVCGGYYPASPLDRLRGLGCWHCENRCVFPGYNDFKTKYPGLAKFYSKNNFIPSSSRLFDPSMSVKWTCARCGKDAMASFREAEKKHGIVYCYACKKEMMKEGHRFYKIEENAIREVIGDEAYEKKERYNEGLKELVHSPSVESEVKLKEIADAYRGEKKK